MIARGRLNRAAIDTCLAGSGRMSVALRSRHPLPSPPVSATSPPMPRDYFQRRRYKRRITSAAMVGGLSALVAWALTRQPAAQVPRHLNKKSRVPLFTIPHAEWIFTCDSCFPKPAGSFR